MIEEKEGATGPWLPFPNVGDDLVRHAFERAIVDDDLPTVDIVSPFIQNSSEVFGVIRLHVDEWNLQLNRRGLFRFWFNLSSADLASSNITRGVSGHYRVAIAECSTSSKAVDQIQPELIASGIGAQPVEVRP